MIDMWTSCVAAPKRLRENIKCLHQSNHPYIASNQYPPESNLQSSPVKRTQHSAHGANQPAKTTWHYFKGLVEKVGELWATFRASSGVRPQENLQRFLRYLFRADGGTSTNLPHIFPLKSQFIVNSLFILMIILYFSYCQQIKKKKKKELSPPSLLVPKTTNKHAHF